MTFENTTWKRNSKQGTSMKLSEKTPNRKRLYALKNELGQISNNSDEVIEVAEAFYRKLYNNSRNKQTKGHSWRLWTLTYQRKHE